MKAETRFPRTVEAYKAHLHEDRPRTGRYHPGEVQPVQIRHLDI